jgi:hypothetical protein
MANTFTPYKGKTDVGTEVVVVNHSDRRSGKIVAVLHSIGVVPNGIVVEHDPFNGGGKKVTQLFDSSGKIDSGLVWIEEKIQYVYGEMYKQFDTDWNHEIYWFTSIACLNPSQGVGFFRARLRKDGKGPDLNTLEFSREMKFND